MRTSFLGVPNESGKSSEMLLTLRSVWLDWCQLWRVPGVFEEPVFSHAEVLMLRWSLELVERR